MNPKTIAPINRYIEMQQLELHNAPHPDNLDAATTLLIKSGIRFYTENCFSIPEPIASRYFSAYYLLYWSGSHLLSQIEAGYIEDYKVKYHSHLCRGSILANPTQQYALSFRRSTDHWNIAPMVLVSGRSTQNV